MQRELAAEILAFTFHEGVTIKMIENVLTSEGSGAAYAVIPVQEVRNRLSALISQWGYSELKSAVAEAKKV